MSGRHREIENLADAISAVWTIPLLISEAPNYKESVLKLATKIAKGLGVGLRPKDMDKARYEAETRASNLLMTREAAIVTKLEQVAAHVCWECRSVTLTNDLWAKDGCPKCGNHGYAIPMVLREREAQLP